LVFQRAQRIQRQEFLVVAALRGIFRSPDLSDFLF